MPKPNRSFTDLSTIFRIWSLTLSERRLQFLALSLIQLAYIPFALLQLLHLKVLADQVVGGKPLPVWASSLSMLRLDHWITSLSLVAILSILISALAQFHHVIAWLWTTKIEQDLAYQFRSTLFAKSLTVRLRELERNGVSDALYHISQDSESIKQLTVGLTRYAASLLSIIGFAVVMIRINPIMTFLAFSPLPITFFVLVKTKLLIRKSWDHSFALDNQSFNILNETLSLSRIVRTFKLTRLQSRRYQQAQYKSIKSVLKASQCESLLDSLSVITFAMGHTSLFVAGAWFIKAKTMTFGDLLIFHAYASQLYDPLEKLSRLLGDIQQDLSKSARAMSLYDMPSERRISTNKTSLSLHQSCGKIEFINVTYYSPGNTERLILSNFSIKVQPGSIVGIAGPSGSGKSTLLDLLLRFDDPTEGVILVDNVDTQTIDPIHLRNHFAVMGQDNALFSGTIAQNILHGRSSASDADMSWALEMAGLKSFIMTLPLGIHTDVGQRGSALSGGQRQRVAFARTILRHAPVLLMDEPTSALDSQTELFAIQSILTLRDTNKFQSMLLVTHSDALLAACDKVVYMA